MFGLSFLSLTNIFLVFIVILFITLSTLYTKSYFKNKRVQNIIDKNGYKQFTMLPGALPIVGHIIKFSKLDPDNRLDTFLAWTKQYGKTIAFRMPVDRFLVFTADPKVIRHFIATAFNDGIYGKGRSLKEQYGDFLGNGIFTVNGDEWKKQRAIARGMFHTTHLKEFIGPFYKNAECLFNKVERLKLKANYKEDGIDLQEYFFRYTLDSFAEIGFGVKLRSIDDELYQFGKAFDVVQLHSARRGRMGDFWKIKEFFFPPTAFKNSLTYMNDYTFKIIKARQGESIEQLKARKDLISRLLVNYHENGEVCTSEELRDFVMNFLIAGRDTTAMLLTWCCYLLSQHPDVEAKVLQEIDENVTFANKEENEEQEEDSYGGMSYDKIKTLKYTRAVLNETLRLYPPVPMDGYAAFKDDVIPGNKFVPKDGIIIYSAYVLHRDPEVYPEPERFNPDRWASLSSADGSLDPYAFLPFHGGPRTCLGMEMAYVEATVMLVHMLRRYKISIVPNHVVALKQGIILTAKFGMKVHLTKRDQLQQQHQQSTV